GRAAGADEVVVIEDLDGTLAPALSTRGGGPVVALVRPDRVVLGCFPAPLPAAAAKVVPSPTSRGPAADGGSKRA
ncbi:MAG TPA: hypothetical protein VGD43_19565, partial [Micromonospora sp.]